MIVKLLTEHHLEFQNFKGGCRGSSEHTLVKMPYCWKSHVAAQLLLLYCWALSRETFTSLIPAEFQAFMHGSRKFFQRGSNFFLS